MRAFVRYVRGSDEMQRRIELESGASAGLVVSGAYLAAGFLHNNDSAGHIPGIQVEFKKALKTTTSHIRQIYRRRTNSAARF